jgi:2-polyprenyl-6-methoxyphenol hydroxylase-like FAD-dependent oxidoreductase
MDRRGLIQTLYEHLTPESRSKVHTSAEIIGAESTDSGVVVTTKGGSTHKGSILVGADGVHSQVRELIWQLAKKDKPWYMSATDENCEWRRCFSEYVC